MASSEKTQLRIALHSLTPVAWSEYFLGLRDLALQVAWKKNGWFALGNINQVGKERATVEHYPTIADMISQGALGPLNVFKGPHKFGHVLPLTPSEHHRCWFQSHQKPVETYEDYCMRPYETPIQKIQWSLTNPPKTFWAADISDFHVHNLRAGTAFLQLGLKKTINGNVNPKIVLLVHYWGCIYSLAIKGRIEFGLTSGISCGLLERDLFLPMIAYAHSQMKDCVFHICSLALNPKAGICAKLHSCPLSPKRKYKWNRTETPLLWYNTFKVWFLLALCP